jgi:hypothetical protein
MSDLKLPVLEPVTDQSPRRLMTRAWVLLWQRTIDAIAALEAAVAGTFASVTLTSDAPSTPAVGTLYRDSIVSAWASVTVTPTLENAVNIALLTDNGTGDVTLDFAEDMTVATYAPSHQLFGTDGGWTLTVSARALGSIRVLTFDDTDAPAYCPFALTIVGGWQV